MSSRMPAPVVLPPYSEDNAMSERALIPCETGPLSRCGGSDRANTAANSGGTAGQTRGRPFQPGRSGNPTGRPRSDLDLAALARTYTPEALETLVAVMQDAKSPAAARVSAASALLDRGWGKARQALDARHRLDFVDEFESFLRDLGNLGAAPRGGKLR